LKTNFCSGASKPLVMLLGVLTLEKDAVSDSSFWSRSCKAHSLFMFKVEYGHPKALRTNKQKRRLNRHSSQQKRYLFFIFFIIHSFNIYLFIIPSIHCH